MVCAHAHLGEYFGGSAVALGYKGADAHPWALVQHRSDKITTVWFVVDLRLESLNLSITLGSTYVCGR